MAQIIRDSIEKENRALKQQIKQLQLNEQKRNHLRNPFQPKNPKIFSKPNFPVSKTFSGRNSASKYRPGGSSSHFNFQNPMPRFQLNKGKPQATYNLNGERRSHPDRGVAFDEAAKRAAHQASPSTQQPGGNERHDCPHLSKKDESIDESEVIEELIEIEDSGDEQSDNNNSVTVRTNCAGGRGSIYSGNDGDTSNLPYYEEFKQHGGRLSPQAVLSQRFCDQQSFYGFRRDLTKL